MTNPRHDNKLMSAVDAAAELGVSRQRIHQLVKDRKLTGLRDRTFLYVPVAEVKAMKAQRDAAMRMPPGMLTKEAVAVRFGVNPRTVNDWHQKGQLRGVMTASHRLVFDPRDVESFTPPPMGRRPRQ